MLRRPTPKHLTADEVSAITKASAQQTGKTQRVRSYDPDYPVFEVPVNQKILAYVPNHTVVDEDGTVHLRMDKFAAHPVIEGRSFADVRCSYGVNIPSLGLDGSCPFCDCISENWDLYHYELNGIAKAKGIDPEAPESKELLKADSTDLLRHMTVKNAEVWYTFPIVVIECEEKDGQLTVTPKKDANGRIKGTPMWYSVRERTYKEKWEAGFDSYESENGTPENPAGLWAILNFTYTPKNGTPDKMGSARALKVSFKTMGESYDQWATYFDKETEDWTPAKAQEVVVLDVIRDMDEMTEACNEIMKPVRDKIAMHKLSETSGNVSTAPAVSTDASDALKNFGGTAVADEPQTPPVGIGEMPNTGVE